MKFADCIDAAVFDQAIHQFVLKESGSVCQFYYGDQYGYNSGYSGDTSTFDYKNSKLNIQVSYWLSDHDIRVTAMDMNQAINAVRDVILKTTADDYDEGKVIGGGSDEGCSLFNIILLIGILSGLLYYFKKKIDLFVEKNPKYAKTWSILCAVGRQIKSLAMAVYRFAFAKYKEYKDKKSSK